MQNMEQTLKTLLEANGFTCYPTVLTLEKPTICTRTNPESKKQEVMTLIPVYKDGQIVDYVGNLVIGNQLFEVQFVRQFQFWEQITNWFKED